MTPDSRLLLACEAMATRFELVLHGEDHARLRAAGEEALAEILRIEARLSYFRPTSDIGRVNAAAAGSPIRVSRETFDLIYRARTLWERTGGAFDITIAPLMRYWGFRGERTSAPAAEALEEVRARVGMHLVELNEGDSTVRFLGPGVQLDLGAIGKGYALDEAARILTEAGLGSALVHGGTSTVRAIGRPPDTGVWKVAIEHPESDDRESVPLAVVPLQDQALSVSAVWGRTVSHGARTFGHVIDPRSGSPAGGARLAAVVAESATDADALSTALLTLGLDEHDVVTSASPDLPVLVLGPDPGTGHAILAYRGIEIIADPRRHRGVAL